MLLPFQPLALSWSGRGELRTLIRAEWRGPYSPLRGQALICGFYLNELLLKLLPRDDPHEGLFEVYADTLAALARDGEQASVLRRFEMCLLQELGYAVILDRDVERDEPVARDRNYVYVVERGPVYAAAAHANGVELSGQTLLDMQSGNFDNAPTQQQSKLLMRTLINHCLGDQVLHTRQLLRDLQEI
jgi:DNA repair protein RecO (recombination protein O)